MLQAAEISPAMAVLQAMEMSPVTVGMSPAVVKALQAVEISPVMAILPVAEMFPVVLPATAAFPENGSNVLGNNSIFPKSFRLQL